jgi:hypothetical protein
MGPDYKLALLASLSDIAMANNGGELWRWKLVLLAEVWV